jgi:hypothetical protein
LRTRLLEDHEGAITRDKYNVGDFVSTDQFICKTPGRLPTGYGRESQDRCYQGGTIFNDAASGLIWVENQVSLGAYETVMSKARFKQWLFDHVSVKSNIIMVTMVSSLLKNFGMAVRKNDRVNPSPVLAPNTRMPVLNVLFKPSCIWHVPSWFMPPFIGRTKVLTIFLSRPLQ